MSRRMASSHLSCSMNFSPIRLQREQRNFRYMKLGPNTRTYQLRCSTSLATMRCPQWHLMAVVFMLKIFPPKLSEKQRPTPGDGTSLRIIIAQSACSSNAIVPGASRLAVEEAENGGLGQYDKQAVELFGVWSATSACRRGNA